VDEQDAAVGMPDDRHLRHDMISGHQPSHQSSDDYVAYIAGISSLDSE
jgi:hypothetical protein